MSGSGAGHEKIRWSMSGAGAGGRVSGVTENDVSGEQKFRPLPLRSHVLPRSDMVLGLKGQSNAAWVRTL